LVITRYGFIEKTSFITPFGTYCYIRMPMGLRNIGPTFCRMTKAALMDEVGKNVLSYVGDIVVASRKDTYISDLVETFVKPGWSLTKKSVYLGHKREGT
jgi:hypothetical protein